MPTCVRDFHAGADVDAEIERTRQWHGFLADDFTAERVRGEILHRDGVIALDEQEVVDADDVVVRDLARVTQLVHEALHDLLVFRDVRIEELKNEALVDDGVFHEQHRAERALADALDVFVAAFDDVAGLERLDVEFLRARHLLGLLDRTLHFLLRHEQRARRLLRRARLAEPRGAARWRRCRRGRWRECGVLDACVAPSGRPPGVLGVGHAVLGRRQARAAHREARVEIRQRSQRRLRDGLFVVRGLRLDLHTDSLEASFVGEFGERGDGLEPDLLFVALEHRQHGVDDLVIAEPAERTHDDGQGARRCRRRAFPAGAARNACCRFRRAHRRRVR